METNLNILKSLWQKLYGTENDLLFEELYSDIADIGQKSQTKNHEVDPNWYKDAVVYALYVDLFAGDFEELSKRLPYFTELGVNCLWLLPVLESPMKDAGFDVSNYRKIRSGLLGSTGNQSVFDTFIQQAQAMGIRIIFDIAINHTSNEHPWFKESKKSPENPYRNYYIWSNDASEYADCRLLFEGMCPSNWEPCKGAYYFHRFFEFQPDLNYKNPLVLAEMVKTILFWAEQGIHGFRADAIPYLWKTEGSDCENLPETHLIVKFLRAAIDAAAPGTLLLAEACQHPAEVVKYLGNGDECHAAYHFPLMPMIFKSLAIREAYPIIDVLKTSVTPEIPSDCQWFTFLRVHDELSLEKVYVNEADRQLLHQFYCRKPEWDFRLGQGISARLSELMNNDPKKILLAFSIMLSLPGTPLIYYGDEFAKQNDEDYYRIKSKETGYSDSRYYVRGSFDLEKNLAKAEVHNSIENKVYYGLKKMLAIRNSSCVFGHGDLLFEQYHKSLLIYKRSFLNETLLFVHNLGDSTLKMPIEKTEIQMKELTGNTSEYKGHDIYIEPGAFHWFRLDNE